jgi:outer membrane protein TolC
MIGGERLREQALVHDRRLAPAKTSLARTVLAKRGMFALARPARIARGHVSGVAKLALAAIALVPAACKSVDHEQEIAEWRGVVDADAPRDIEPLQPGEALTLTRALVLANRFNESIGLSGEDYLQALIDKKRQLALLMPTINLVPTYFSRDPGNLTGALGQNHHFDVPVSAGYTNFLPYSQVASLYTAAATIEEKRAVLLDVKASVLLDVAQAYYQVLRAERSVDVLANSLSLQEERVRDVEAQNQVGVARTLDVAQAAAQAANTRVALVQARSNVVTARAALAFAIGAVATPGVPSVDGTLADDFQVPAEVEPLAALEEDALAQRQDYIAAQNHVHTTLEAVDIAVGQYYPSVSLNLSYFLYRETVPDNSLWSALISANIPIFTFGRIHADVRSAWSVFRQAKLAESQLHRRIQEEVQTSYDNLATSKSRLVELTTQLKAAQEAFDQASDLVKFGRATNLERLIAQDQLLLAQLQLASEEFTLKVSYLELERLSGALNLHVEAITREKLGP